MGNRWVDRLMFAVGLTMVAAALVPRLMRPELTEAQLLVEFWPLWLAIVCGAALVLALARTPRPSHRPRTRRQQEEGQK